MNERVTPIPHKQNLQFQMKIMAILAKITPSEGCGAKFCHGLYLGTDILA